MWQLIIIGSLVLSGIVLSVIISEDLKNSTIERTKKIYSNFILQNTNILFSHDDFESDDLESSKKVFESFYNELQNPEILGIKVWANDATILYSNNEQIIGSKFPENTRYQKAISGEVVTILRDYDIEEKLTIRDVDQVLAIYVPIYNENSIHGVIETYIDPTFLNNSIIQTKTIVSFIIGVMIIIVALIILINFQVTKKSVIEPIKEIEKLTNEISEKNFKITNTITNANANDEIKNLNNNIHQMINRLHDSNNTLKNFKQVLDKSSLVTITDPNGKITYANDLFCNI